MALVPRTARLSSPPVLSWCGAVRGPSGLAWSDPTRRRFAIAFKRFAGAETFAFKTFALSILPPPNPHCVPTLSLAALSLAALFSGLFLAPRLPRPNFPAELAWSSSASGHFPPRPIRSVRKPWRSVTRLRSCLLRSGAGLHSLPERELHNAHFSSRSARRRAARKSG